MNFGQRGIQMHDQKKITECSLVLQLTGFVGSTYIDLRA